MFYINFILISVPNMNIFVVMFSILYTLIILLCHCVLITLLRLQCLFFFIHMQYLNIFACIITSLFSCSWNFYLLYYDLFFIQRFCYVSWIFGMWNKLELQMHRRGPRSILYTMMVTMQVCEILLSRFTGRGVLRSTITKWGALH